MNTVDKQAPRPADAWTWMVIGLVFGAVTVALYGPFVWELAHRAA